MNMMNIRRVNENNRRDRRCRHHRDEFLLLKFLIQKARHMTSDDMTNYRQFSRNDRNIMNDVCTTKCYHHH